MTKTTILALLVAATCAVLLAFKHFELVAMRNELEIRDQKINALSQRISLLETSLAARAVATEKTADAPPPTIAKPAPSTALTVSESSSSSQSSPVPWSAVKRKVVRTQMRASMKALYGDFVKEQGLSDVDANTLYDLLSDYETQSASNTDGRSAASLLETQKQNNAQLDTQIRTALGGALADAFSEYRETLPARSEVSQLAAQLQAANVPMTEAQRMQIARAITQDRHDYGGPALSPQISGEELQKAYAEWNQARQDRLGIILQGILSAQQMQQYSELKQAE